MSAALAFALSLSATAWSPAALQDDVAKLVQDACVETGFDRTAFERLGRERRWRPSRMRQRSGEPGWIVAFRTDDGTVMLAGDRDSNEVERRSGVMCSVSVERARPELEDELVALATSLGLGAEGTLADNPPGFAPIRIWSRFGGQTLTYSATADGRAVISFSRQIVTNETAPASPPES
jgi:hypothetical protein